MNSYITTKNIIDIKLMCKVLKISRNSYYKYINKKLINRELENQKIKKEILKIYQNSKKRYRVPKITASLKLLGINISLKRTQHLMNKLVIKSIVTKKFRPLKILGAIYIQL